jgi:hypothetical protein
MQTEKEWKTTYDNFKDQITSLLHRERLQDALTTVGVSISDMEFSDLFDDSNLLDGLDFESFKAIITKQSPIEQWAKTLPFPSMVADAVPISPTSDPLRGVSMLTRKDIDIIIDGLVDALKDSFEKHVQLLSRGLDATEKAPKVDLDGSKFQVASMSCGRVKDFHVGLDGRLGKQCCAPHSFSVALRSANQPDPGGRRRPIAQIHGNHEA